MQNTILTMDVFMAVAEPTRRAIVELLAQSGELSATEISSQFAASAPAISQHLKVLRDAEIVSVARQAQQRIYRLNPGAMQDLAAWAQRMAERWEERFTRLDAVLAREMARQSDAQRKDQGNE